MEIIFFSPQIKVLVSQSLCHRPCALITSKLITRVDDRSKHGYENREILEGQERSVFYCLNMTLLTFLSCIQTFLLKGS